MNVYDSMPFPVAGKGNTYDGVFHHGDALHAHVVAQQLPDRTHYQRIHFFNLPGEIRNRIYGFALHEPLGLLCIRGPDNVGRLCLQFEQKWRNVSDSYSGRVLPPRMVPEADGKFRDSVVKWKYDKGQVANQLQFVNCQFRQDTKGYGLRHNSITFTRSSDYGALRQFLDFVKELPTTQYKHLTTIVLQDRGAKERKSDFKAVSQFCRDNPHILVKVRGADILPAKFLFDTLIAALRWKQIYREDSAFITKITSNPVLQQKLLRWNRVAVGPVPIPPTNLRMFPADETFNVEAFRRLCMADIHYYVFTRNTPGGFDSWIPWIEDWYKNGL